MALAGATTVETLTVAYQRSAGETVVIDDSSADAERPAGGACSGCNFIGGTMTKDATAVVDYFLHNFDVTSPTQLTRAGVIAALQAKTFEDWTGIRIADSEWERLVRAYGETQTLLMTSPTKPDAASIKQDVVDNWKRDDNDDRIFGRSALIQTGFDPKR